MPSHFRASHNRTFSPSPMHPRIYAFALYHLRPKGRSEPIGTPIPNELFAYFLDDLRRKQESQLLLK